MWPFKQTSGNQPEAGEKVTLHLDGMHCASCALTIDDELEELPGVQSARTSFAKGETAVSYDSSQVNVSDIKNVITQLGYKVKSAA